MELEIELKLLAPENAGDIIEQKVLPDLNCKVKTDKVELSNYYFDTPERILRKHDIGLRIRGKANLLEQTLKTAGKSVAGLQQRPEYNVQLGDKIEGLEITPNLDLFDSTAWPDNFDVEHTQKNIEVLFVTDFTRHIYLLNLDNGTQIEMVWDKGHVSAKGKSAPICEVELELVKGSACGLFMVAKHLLKFMYLSIGTDSKAARGYQLADNTEKQEPEDTLETVINQSAITTEQFVAGIEQALNHLQYYFNKIAQHYTHSSAQKIAKLLNIVESLFCSPAAVTLTVDKVILLAKVKILNQKWSLFLVNVADLPEDRVLPNQVGDILFQPEVTALHLDIVHSVLGQ